MMDMLEVGTSEYLQFNQLGLLKMLTASWSGDDKYIPSVSCGVHSYVMEKHIQL
jgi:hypothetical protein